MCEDKDRRAEGEVGSSRALVGEVDWGQIMKGCEHSIKKLGLYLEGSGESRRF